MPHKCNVLCATLVLKTLSQKYYLLLCDFNWERSQREYLIKNEKLVLMNFFNQDKIFTV